MPGLSGDQLAESIHERNPALPVVMVTGMSDLMRANGEKPSHCRMVLGKPVSQASLRVALQQAVAN
jgi:FixJ family two-component response regulator